MPRKENIFQILAVLVPLAVLVAIEAVLRLAGAGFSTDIFIRDPLDSRYLVMNTDISRKYFATQENATVGNIEPFLARKTARTKRFFVLGASTSLGFPYMHNGSFPRMLKYKLQFEHPKDNIEVVNLSLTAVNTYTLLDFSRKILPYEPDGIIIYTGQNEYYGAMGAAVSKGKPWMKRLAVRAMELRIVQILSRPGAKHRRDDCSVTDNSRTLMERMSMHVEIPLGSPIHEAGIKQYEDNLGRILRLFSRKGIPVFLCTLASNYRDQGPLDKGKESISSYSEGLAALGEGRIAEAEKFFAKALDLDAIRFRAPREFNGIIRDFAAGVEGVHLVDVDSLFREREPDGIIGKELMLEHVHPNLGGHILIAEACHALISEAILGGIDPDGGFSVNLSEDYPLTSLDTCFCLISMHQLKTQWPFNEPEEAYSTDTTSFGFINAGLVFYKKINWGEGMQRLNNHYMKAGNYQEALKVLEQMCLEVPYGKEFFAGAENISYGTGRTDKSEFYGRRAR